MFTRNILNRSDKKYICDLYEEGNYIIAELAEMADTTTTHIREILRRDKRNPTDLRTKGGRRKNITKTTAKKKPTTPKKNALKMPSNKKILKEPLSQNDIKDLVHQMTIKSKTGYVTYQQIFDEIEKTYQLVPEDFAPTPQYKHRYYTVVHNLKSNRAYSLTDLDKTKYYDLVEIRSGFATRQFVTKARLINTIENNRHVVQQNPDDYDPLEEFFGIDKA